MKWKRFLLVQLPAALVVSAALAEGAASALGGVAPRRHDLDRLAAALDHVTMDAPVVVAGDSVTQDVLKTYRVGPEGAVANLTTNQASGLAGTYLLLKRYLEHSRPPRHVVVAATPEFLAYTPTGKAADIYVRSVFRRPDERALLARQLGDGDAAWRPAVLALEGRLGDPLTGVLAVADKTLPIGDQEPTAIAVEPGPVLAGVEPQIRERGHVRLALSPSAGQALEGICALSRQHGFTLHLVRAPVPESVESARRDGGYADLERAVAAATGDCAATVTADINRRERFPDHAFRDADHLRRPGWTARYAALLNEYVAALP